jgi:N12 class adenine-specific DNA methylase
MEVGVERGAVDLSHVSDILHSDRVETLLSEESFNGLQDQTTGPFDAGVKFLFLN